MEKVNEKKDQAPGQNKEYQIIVNGKPKSFVGKKITFKEVILLGFGSGAFDEKFNYTVMYSKGNQEDPKGTLVEGKSVNVKENMLFNVKRTIRS